MKTAYDAVNEFNGEWRRGSYIHYSNNDDNWYFSNDRHVRIFHGQYTMICKRDQFNDLVSQMETNFGECANIDLFNYTHGTKELLTKELEVMDKVSCYVCHVGAYPMQQYCGSCGHELLSELVPPQPTITHAQGYDIKGDGDSKTPAYTQAMADNGELPSVGMECCYSSLNRIVWNKCTIIAYYDGFVWTSDNGIRQLNLTAFKPLTPPIELIDGGLYLFDAGNSKKLVGEAYLSDFAGDWMLSALRTNSNYNANGCTNIQPLTVEVK